VPIVRIVDFRRSSGDFGADGLAGARSADGPLLKEWKTFQTESAFASHTIVAPAASTTPMHPEGRRRGERADGMLVVDSARP